MSTLVTVAITVLLVLVVTTVLYFVWKNNKQNNRGTKRNRKNVLNTTNVVTHAGKNKVKSSNKVRTKLKPVSESRQADHLETKVSKKPKIVTPEKDVALVESVRSYKRERVTPVELAEIKCLKGTDSDNKGWEASLRQRAHTLLEYSDHMRTQEELHYASISLFVIAMEFNRFIHADSSDDEDNDEVNDQVDNNIKGQDQYKTKGKDENLENERFVFFKNEEDLSLRLKCEESIESMLENISARITHAVDTNTDGVLTKIENFVNDTAVINMTDDQFENMEKSAQDNILEMILLSTQSTEFGDLNVSWIERLKTGNYSLRKRYKFNNVTHSIK